MADPRILGDIPQGRLPLMGTPQATDSPYFIGKQRTQLPSLMDTLRHAGTAFKRQIMRPPLTEPELQEMVPYLVEAGIAGNPFKKSVAKKPVYHATATQFENFDPNLAGTSGLGRTGKTKATHFTSTLDEAKEYKKSVFNVEAYYNYIEKYENLARNLSLKANKTKVDRQLLKEYRKKTRVQLTQLPEATKDKRIIEAYVNIENPIVYDVKGRVTSSRDLVRKLTKQAKENGNDGIILKNIRSFSPDIAPADHYIVFSPEQIMRK